MREDHSLISDDYFIHLKAWHQVVKQTKGPHDNKWVKVWQEYNMMVLELVNHTEEEKNDDPMNGEDEEAIPFADVMHHDPEDHMSLNETEAEFIPLMPIIPRIDNVNLE